MLAAAGKRRYPASGKAAGLLPSDAFIYTIYKGILRDEHGTFCIKHSITNRSYRSKSVSDSNRRIWWHDRLVRPVCKKWIFPTRVNPSQYTSRHRRTYCGAIQIHHAVKPIISHILGKVNDESGVRGIWRNEKSGMRDGGVVLQ